MSKAKKNTSVNVNVNANVNVKAISAIGTSANNTSESSAKYKNCVVDGSKAKDLEKKIAEYLVKNIAAAEQANSLSTLVISYSDFLKAFAAAEPLKTKDGKSVLLTSVSNLDLHKIIFKCLYTISKQRKENGAARIVVMKNNNGACGTICTVKTEFYSQYFGTSEKKAATAAKAKESREKKAAEKKAKEQEESAKESRIPIDNPTAATAAILNLITEFGIELDTKAIYTALDNLLAAANTDVISA